MLDAWALIAFLDGEEPAAARVQNALAEGEAVACSVNVGEVLYRQIRTVGLPSAREGVAALRGDMETVDPDWSLVTAAAEVKAAGGLSHADAFCVATAQRLDAALWTGDPEIIERVEEFRCAMVDLRHEG